MPLFSATELMDSFKNTIDFAFESYNIKNLENHLNWATNKTINENPKNKKEYVDYLIQDFKEQIIEKDEKTAKKIYNKLEFSLKEFYENSNKF